MPIVDTMLFASSLSVLQADKRDSYGGIFYTFFYSHESNRKQWNYTNQKGFKKIVDVYHGSRLTNSPWSYDASSQKK